MAKPSKEPKASAEGATTARGRRLPVFRWAVVLFVLPALVYVGYVFDQFGRLDERNLRLLDSVARRLEEVLVGARGNVENLARSFEGASELPQRQPFLTLEAGDASTAERLERLDEWERDLVTLKLLRGAERPEMSVRTALVGDREGIQLVAGVGFAAENALPRSVLDLSGRAVRSGLSGLVGTLEAEARRVADLERELQLRLTVKLRVQLGQILDGVPLGEAFDHVLLVAPGGQVRVHRAPEIAYGDPSAGLRIASLAGLETVGGQPWLPELVTGADGGDVGKGAAGDDDGGAARAARLAHSSHVSTVRLADRRFRLLCQPARLNGFLPSARRDDWTGGKVSLESEVWAVCGLVGGERNLREALAVAPQLVLLLGLLVVLGFLAWPFVKLFVMERRERFKLADAFALLVCTFALLLLATLLLVAADTFHGLRHAYGRGLERLADRVEGELEAELVGLHAQLERYDRELCGSYGGGRPALPQGSRDFRLLLAQASRYGESSPEIRERTADPKIPAWTEQRVYLLDPESIVVPPLLLSQAEWRWFDLVFWMDGSGRQIAKAAVRDQPTPPVTLGHRAYFRAIRERRGWPWRLGGAEGGDAGERFYLESIVSVTTGERSAVLSMPSCLEPDAGDDLVVAAISARPQVLIDPVVPQGFAFAVVDARGLAVFHSTPSRALEENLFHEVTDHRRLRAAMEARGEEHFSSRYRARPHRLCVRPMAAVPLWLVTLYDEEQVKTVNIEATGQAVLLCLLYLFIALAVLTAIYLATRRRGALWLWPEAGRRPLYRRIFGVALVFLLLEAVALATFEGAGLVRAMVVLPAALFAIVVALHLAWRGGAAAGERPARELPPGAVRLLRWLGLTSPPSGSLVWHLAAVFVLWLAAAVMPAVGFYASAWNDAMQALLQLEGLHLVEDLEERHRRLESEYERVAWPGGSGKRADALRERSLHLAGGGCRASIFGSHAAWLEQPAPQDEILPGPAAIPGLAALKPIYNPTAGRLRYLRGGGSHDRRQRWLTDPDGTVTLVAETSAFGESLAIRSPDRGPGLRLRWMSAIGGVTLAILLWLWVRYSAYRIFFARLHSQVGAGGMPASRLDEARQPVLALVASPQDERTLLTTGGRAVVDLAAGAGRAEAEERIASLAHGAGEQVVCIHFETGLDDPERRAWKLATLERLVFELRRRLVVPCAQDPLGDLFGPTRLSDREAPPGGERRIELPRDEARRWGRLFSEFVVVPVRVEAPDLSEAGRQTLVESGLPQRLGRRHEEIERRIEAFEGFYWALWTACTPDEQLVLVHLAQERIVNPKQVRAVRRLLQRGLLVRDPTLRLMDRAFELFVQRIHEPLEVERWEAAGGGLGWRQLRWAFGTLLVVVALFLFATQQALLDATLGFVSAIVVGGLPGLIELVARVRRSGGRAGGS